MTYVTIECASTYSSSTDTASHYSVFALYGGSGITSTGTSVKYCNYGSYGIFYAYHVQTISDTVSIYENNTSS